MTRRVGIKTTAEGSPPIDFQGLADEAEGFFVPSAANDHLITAKSYIPMPEELLPVLTEKGLPCGHIIHTAGDSDTGKTTFAVESVKATQQAGGLVVYALSEIKFDIKRAVKMGLDREGMLFYKPRSIETLFESGKLPILNFREKHPDLPILWIWDSISATPSDHELDDKSTNHNMRAANAISGELRRIRSFLDELGVCFLMINRVYEKQVTQPFQKKTATYGGKGPKGFSSIQLEFSRLSFINLKRKIEGKDVKLRPGIVAKIENTKNHLSQPFQTVEVKIDINGFILGGRKVEI